MQQLMEKKWVQCVLYAILFLVIYFCFIRRKVLEAFDIDTSSATKSDSSSDVDIQDVEEIVKNLKTTTTKIGDGLHLDKYRQALGIHQQQISNKKRLLQVISILEKDYKGQVAATRAELQLKMGISRGTIMQFISDTKLPVRRNSRLFFYFRVKDTILRAKTLLYQNQWAHYRLFE